MHIDLEPILHMYEDLVPILQMCDKIVTDSSHICENRVPILHTGKTSSPKGNDRLHESHYKSMGTFKILKDS